MPAHILARFRHQLHHPHGLILVTGPTGSGKTTTLYAALREINQPARKIITAEDPVEYRMERINQVHVNRSEEHTSELQSLMRISYAVFCLKNKKKISK